MVKITVLVAIYNAERYLSMCLNSLVCQTIRDIQVVCIDDASTDASLKILDKYARRDDRIEVIHLEKNGGQAKARNIGLKQAKGIYTCFLDSDDWFAPDALEKVIAKFEESDDYDCVLFRAKYAYPIHNVNGVPKYRFVDYDMHNFNSMTGKEAFVDSLTWKIHGIYAVKTSIHLRFPYDDSCHSYSDDNTTRLHYLASRKVAMCDGIYYYRQHKASVTHQVSIRRFDYLDANTHMKQYLQCLHVEEKYLHHYENHRWLNLIALYQFAIQHKTEFQKDDYHQAMQMLRATWQSIDVSALTPRNHYKIGYVPFLSIWMPEPVGWFLFSCEQKIYHRLRKVLRRNSEV